MLEGIPNIQSNTSWKELLSQQDKPISLTDFESIVSLLPGYSFPPDFLQETLRGYEVVKVNPPRNPNPPVYWHLADLPDGENDLLRFALSVSDSYKIGNNGKYLVSQPMISRLCIGVERWRDDDQSLHVYYYFFANSGQLECVDIADKSYTKGHRGWMKIHPTDGVIEHFGTMEPMSKKVAKLKSISLESFMREFFKTDQPFNLLKALGVA